MKVNHISCLRPIIEVPRECRQPETSRNDISITNDSLTLFEVFEIFFANAQHCQYLQQSQPCTHRQQCQHCEQYQCC